MQEFRMSAASYPIVAVGLSMTSFIMIKTARDAVFFQESGLRHLPLAYIWIAVAAVPAALIHLRVLDRLGARRTRTALFFVAAVVFLAFVPFTDTSHGSIMTGMFISVPIVFAAVFAGAWLLASDLLEGTDGAHLSKIFTRIGAASMVGGIMGGLISKGVGLFLEPRFLVAGGSRI